MKKILMGSAVLTAFSLAIIAFQMSCQKTVKAQTSNNTPSLTQLNKLVFIKFNYQANKPDGIYISNYDGSGQEKINVTLSAYGASNARLSPDGKTLFFETNGEPDSLFSCNIDGTNLIKVFGDGINDYLIQGAY